MSDAIHDEVLALILDGERQAATDLVAQWAETHDYERAVTDVLEPVLNTIGKRWATSDELSLGQGFVAAKVCEDILTRAAEVRRVDAPPGSSKGPVVIGNIEDDSHALGRKMVVSFLRLEGWAVVDLGNDVPAVEFVDRSVEVGAPIVAVSAMMYHTARNIKQLREEIDRRGLTGQIQLAVGGAVFVQRPELVGELGGDGTARNALEAPALMDRLLTRARGEKPRHE